MILRGSIMAGAVALAALCGAQDARAQGSFTLTSQHISPGLEPVTIGAGTLLGELALLTATVRPVTATALEASSVIRIPRTLFLRMLDGYPDAAQRLRVIIAKRADQAITDIQSVRPVLDIAD